MVVAIRIGQFIALRIGRDFGDNPGNSVITGSLYGLLGLLLAFTFGMSGDRFKERKNIITQEANNISTAVLRTKLYADSVQPLFMANFKPYLEARIKYFAVHRDTVQIAAAMKETDRYGKILFSIAAKNSRIPANLVASNQMIPALNAMIDITTTRFWSEYNGTPASILYMLFSLSVAAAFLAGYTSVGKGKFDWSLAIGFCFLISLVIFFIIDLDKPRSGIITLDTNARAIVSLRKMVE